jgi:hypothetical protein
MFASRILQAVADGERDALRLQRFALEGWTIKISFPKSADRSARPNKKGPVPPMDAGTNPSASLGVRISPASLAPPSI